MAELKIGVQVSATIQMRSGPMSDFDFMKPTVWAELKFENVPTEEELKQQWAWLWESQVAPQAEALLDLMVAEADKREIFRDPDIKRDLKPVTQEDVDKQMKSTTVPPNGAYT